MGNAPGYGCRGGWRRNRSHGVLMGLSIVLLGSLLLMQNLGILAGMHVGKLWPVILIAAGVSRLVNTAHPGIRLWGAAMTAAGTLLLLTNFHYLSPHIWRYIGPSAMILWGIALLVIGPRFRQMGAKLTANQG
jgi:hypothetical protein